MKIIAFTGQMGVGKSTAIDRLAKTIPGTSFHTNVKFAAPLYDMQKYIYSRISSAYKRPTDFIKDRKLLQWLGTEFGRNLDESLWVNLWKREVEGIEESASLLYLASGIYVTCDDCRFDNEAEAVKDLGGTIIKLTSTKNVDRITTANGIVNHSSEVGVSEKYIDYTVDNNDTLEAFYKKLDKVYREVL